MVNIMPVTGWVMPDWTIFFVMAGAFLTVAAGGIIWIVFFHKTKRRRRKYRYRHHRHRHSHPSGMMLAQNGGSVPAHHEDEAAGPPSPTPRS